MAEFEIDERDPEVDSRIERKICLGMITSERFLKEISSMFDPGMLRLGFARTLAGWCFDYWGRYRKPPGRHIEDLYILNKGDLPEGDSEKIRRFLTDIVDEYDRGREFNSQYILDKAIVHFRLGAIRSAKERLEESLASGDPKIGEEAIRDFRSPAKVQDFGKDPYRDIEFIVDSVTPEDESKDIVMKLPGELGKAVGPLERGFFAAIQAESGIGKTWWLLWLAELAAFAGFDVVFFSLEMSSYRLASRVWQWTAGLPTEDVPDSFLNRSSNGNVVGILEPVFDCMKNQTGECIDGCGVAIRKKIEGGSGRFGRLPEYQKRPSGYFPCTKCRKDENSSRFEPFSWWKEAKRREKLDPASALKKHAMLDRSGALKRMGRFRLVEFYAQQHSVEDLDAYLNNLEYYDGFVPSVIIVDYADKLKWPVPKDERVSISQIWQAHKALAMKRHCLFVTASQSNTMRTGKKVGRGSWYGTQEKEHILDVGIALNQTAQNQASGVVYASVVKRRHGQTDRTSELMVLQNLSIGRPYVDSCKVREGHE